MPPLLDLRLFGGFDARLPSGPGISVTTKKGRALLAYLALAPGSFQAREKLATLLWGGASDQQARASLRQSIAGLRQALKGPATRALVADVHMVSLVQGSVTVDVLEFERLVAAGSPTDLERAAALYRGDLLDGTTVNESAFEEWLLAQRERLREAAVDALRRLLAHQSWTGAVDRGIQTAGRLLAINPLEEGPHRALMGLYLRQGRRAAALRQYQICVATLKRDLGAQPEPETLQLYQSIVGFRMPGTRSSPAALDPKPETATDSGDVPLVGREETTAVFARCLQRAARGQQQIVVVTGEAGVGRTRLVEWVADEAARRGARVLSGRADETHWMVPFGAWLDVLRFDRVDDTSLIGALDPQSRAQLSTLFPELADPAVAPATVDNRARVFAAVARLLERASGERPLTLVIDDAHWADDASLGLLVFLARRLRACPILIVLTACEEELARAKGLRRLLSRLERDHRAVRVALLPLARTGIATLVRALAGPGVGRSVLERRIEQVWRLSEGNPAVAVEAMRAAPAAGAATDELPVPPRVRDMVLHRLDGLGERSRHVLAIAAVTGGDFDFPLVQDVATLGNATVAGGLEELVTHGLVMSEGERFRIAQTRVRRVVYDGLLAPQRQALQTAVAQVTATRPSAEPR